MNNCTNIITRKQTEEEEEEGTSCRDTARQRLANGLARFARGLFLAFYVQEMGRIQRGARGKTSKEINERKKTDTFRDLLRERKKTILSFLFSQSVKGVVIKSPGRPIRTLSLSLQIIIFFI